MKKKKFDKRWLIFGGIGIVVLIIIISSIMVLNNSSSVPEQDFNNQTSINVEPKKDLVFLTNLQAIINMNDEESFDEADKNKIEFFEIQKKQSTGETKNCISDGSYSGLKLVIWSRFSAINEEEVEEEIVCDVEESYDGRLNQKLSGSYDVYQEDLYDAFLKGVIIPISIDSEKVPEEVIYSITCVGQSSGKSFFVSKRLDVTYDSGTHVVPEIWC